jgi:hypothetical protein
MAKEAGMFAHTEVQPEILRFAVLVAEKEREECASLCEDTSQEYEQYTGQPQALNHTCASAIRARGQKEYRGARLVLTKDGVIQDGWMGESK